MAEKEERICIDVIQAGINCVYRSDHNPKGQALCTHNGEMEPVTAKECRHCQEGMTRQEAIEKLAKALCGDDVIREGYYQMAEIGLNALLDTDTPKDNKN